MPVRRSVLVWQNQSSCGCALRTLLLEQLEQKLGLQNRIGIEGLIEDVSGLLHIEDIMSALTD